MSKTTTSPFVQKVNNLQGQLTSATGANNLVTVFTAGADDAVLKSFGIVSTDTVARSLLVYVNVGGAGTDTLVGTIPVPIAAGSNGTAAAVDVLRSPYLPWPTYDAYGNRVINLKAGSTVKIATSAALSSGAAISAFGEGGDF